MDDLSLPEREALLEHLSTDPHPVVDHIRGGGTVATYVTGWKAARDDAARALEPSPQLLAQVLQCPIPGYGTVRDYLVDLLTTFWYGDGDAKYGMTGESDWRYDIYGALNLAGIIPGWEDGCGLDRDARQKANRLIGAAIKSLGADGGGGA